MRTILFVLSTLVSLPASAQQSAQTRPFVAGQQLQMLECGHVCTYVMHLVHSKHGKQIAAQDVRVEDVRGNRLTSLEKLCRQLLKPAFVKSELLPQCEHEARTVPIGSRLFSPSISGYDYQVNEEVPCEIHFFMQTNFAGVCKPL